MQASLANLFVMFCVEIRVGSLRTSSPRSPYVSIVLACNFTNVELIIIARQKWQHPMGVCPPPASLRVHKHGHARALTAHCALFGTSTCTQEAAVAMAHTRAMQYYITIRPTTARLSTPLCRPLPTGNVDSGLNQPPPPYRHALPAPAVHP